MLHRNLSRAEFERRRGVRRRVLLALCIAGALYLTVPLLLGDMGILKYFGMLKAHHRLTGDIRQMKSENEEVRREVEALRSDPFTIEKMARDQLGLVKEGELVYRFTAPRK